MSNTRIERCKIGRMRKARERLPVLLQCTLEQPGPLPQSSATPLACSAAKKRKSLTLTTFAERNSRQLRKYRFIAALRPSGKEAFVEIHVCLATPA